MSGHVKVAGVWKNFDPYAAIAEGEEVVWKGVDFGYVKVNGVWELWYGIPDIEMNSTTVHRWSAGSYFSDLQVLKEDKKPGLKYSEGAFIASRSPTSNQIVQYDLTPKSTNYTVVSVSTTARSAVRLGDLLVCDRQNTFFTSLVTINAAGTTGTQTLTPPTAGQSIRSAHEGYDNNTLAVAWYNANASAITMALYDSSFGIIRTQDVTVQSTGPLNVRSRCENGVIFVSYFNPNNTRTYAHALKADLLGSARYIGTSYDSSIPANNGGFSSGTKTGMAGWFLDGAAWTFKRLDIANNVTATITGTPPANFIKTGITMINDTKVAIGGYSTDGGVYTPELIKMDITMSSPTAGTYTIRRPYQGDPEWTKFSHTAAGPKAGRPLLMSDGRLAVEVTNDPNTNPAILDHIKIVNGK